MTVQYSASRPAGREHIPLMPKGFIAIRIVQLVLAVLVLALSAFTLSTFPFRANGLSTFVSIMTMGVTIYSLVVEFSRDAWKSYNYWAILSLDIFLLVLWLVSFALMAADVAPWADGNAVCDYWDCYTMGSVLFACLAAIAGLGGAEFVLFIVSLALHSVAVHRHRAAGLHCAPGSSSAAEAQPTGGAVTNHNQNNVPTPQNAIPMSPPQEKQHQHPVPSYTAVAPEHQHQHQPQPQYQQYAGASPSPPSAGFYQPPPVAAQQHENTHSATSSQQYYTTQAQHQQSTGTGGQFSPVTVPAPHPGSYEAQGQPVTYQQQQQ